MVITPNILHCRPSCGTAMVLVGNLVSEMDGIRTRSHHHHMHIGFQLLTKPPHVIM